MRKLIIIGLLLLAVAPFAVAQDDGLNDLTFVTGTPIREFLANLGYDGRVTYPAIAPNGSRLAWEGTEDDEPLLCVLTFATVDMTCTEVPDALSSLGRGLYWSADGRYIATHQELIRLNDEPDLWLFDVENATWANLTDDGIEPPFLDQDGANGAIMDILPTWNPVTNDLYFVRYVDDPETSVMDTQGLVPFTASVQRIAAQDGVIVPGTEPETVADISDVTGSIVSVYEQTSPLLNGATVISPDGSTLAFLSYRLTNFTESAIRLIDLETGELSTLTSVSDVVAVGKPDWIANDARRLNEELPYGLTWSEDSDALIFGTESRRIGVPSPVAPYRITVANGEVAPYVDFSAIPDEQTFITNTDASAYPTAGEVVRYPAYIATSNVLIYSELVPNFGRTGFAALDGAPDDSPVRLLPLDRNAINTSAGVRNVSVGDDGAIVRVISGGYVLTFERNTP